MMKMPVFLATLIVQAAVAVHGDAAERFVLESPEGTVRVLLECGLDGMRWSLVRKGKTVIQPSRLGLEFAGGEWGGMRVAGQRRHSIDSVWENRLARREMIRDRCNALCVMTEEVSAPHRRLNIEFRAYEEGAAFRYVVPEQEALEGFQVRGDLAEWRFSGNPECWAVGHRSHVNSQEGHYKRMTVGGLLPTDALFGMPLVVHAEGQSVALCEANLTDWAGMFFRSCPPVGDGTQKVRAELSPLPSLSGDVRETAVIRTTPAASPWRVALCADSDVALTQTGDMLLNLNPPPEPGLDFSWVKPGACSWDWWSPPFWIPPKERQTTEQELKMVDFAAEMGWPYHLIDDGWYGFRDAPAHGPDVKVVCREGFDLAGIIAHAASKDVGIWVWLHWEALEGNGVESTIERLSAMGVSGVKIDFMDRQDQWMVRWYEKVSRICARHRMMVNFHGAFKPTGTERTWPNVVTREAIQGNEGCKGSDFITPEHAATLPFTRFLLGPGDYTPGSFGNVCIKDFLSQYERGLGAQGRVPQTTILAEEPGTRAHALALCVAFDSPLMTLCDSPERYRGADGIEVLRALPTTWKDTVPVDGEIGSHYAVRRETFGGCHYFAAFTVAPRRVSLPLDFLAGGTWTVTVYEDDAERSPSDAKALAVRTLTVDRSARIDFSLAAEGGAVAVFEPAAASARPVGADSHQAFRLWYNMAHESVNGHNACGDGRGHRERFGEDHVGQHLL